MSTTNISQDDIRRYFDGIGAALSKTNEKALAGIADALLEAHLRGATVFTAGSEGGAAMFSVCSRRTAMPHRLSVPRNMPTAMA